MTKLTLGIEVYFLRNNMKRLTSLFLGGILAMGIATSATAQTKVSSLLITNANGQVTLNTNSSGLLVNKNITLTSSTGKTLLLEVPELSANQTFTFPTTGGTLLTNASGGNVYNGTQTFPTTQDQGNALINSINAGSLQINTARLNLSGYAQESWVTTQINSAIAGLNLGGDISALDARVTALENANYLTTSSLASYLDVNDFATETWVNSQGFLKSADLATNSTITNLQNSITSINNTINDLGSTYATDAELASAISGLGLSQYALASDLTSLGTTVTNNYNTLNTAINNLGSTYATDQELSDAISNIDLSQYALASDLTSLGTTVTNNYNTLNTAITNLSNSVTNLGSTYATDAELTAAINGLSTVYAPLSLVQTYTTGFNSLDGRISALEGNMTTVQGTLASLPTTYAPISLVTTVNNLGSTYATDAELASAISGLSNTYAPISLVTTVNDLGNTYATDAELASAISGLSSTYAPISLVSSVNTNTTAIANLNSTYATDAELTAAIATVSAGGGLGTSNILAASPITKSVSGSNVTIGLSSSYLSDNIAVTSPITKSVSNGVVTLGYTAPSNPSSGGATPGTVYAGNTVVAWGEFTCTETNGSITASPSFGNATIARTAAGTYTVTLPNSSVQTGICVVTFTNSEGGAASAVRNNNVYTLYARKLNGGGLVDKATQSEFFKISYMIMAY
jgi:hypothetical protein